MCAKRPQSLVSNNLSLTTNKKSNNLTITFINHKSKITTQKPFLSLFKKYRAAQ